jgi:hypothetical protein
MEAHYDFSKGQHGEFYSKDALFKLPVYLDEQVEAYLAATAEIRGIELSDLVNDLLKKKSRSSKR